VLAPAIPQARQWDDALRNAAPRPAGQAPAAEGVVPGDGVVRSTAEPAWLRDKVARRCRVYMYRATAKSVVEDPLPVHKRWVGWTEIVCVDGWIGGAMVQQQTLGSCWRAVHV
jgi:hypothetical protein